jgi:hypothetical protein
MALDPFAKEKIDEVVNEWVNAGRMFTAFEVSLAVKERGVRERHRNLRECVHEAIFRLGGANAYTRTLMDVGAPEQAWVYHRLYDNPYTYQPLNRKDSASLPADDPLVVPDGIKNPVPLAANLAAPAAIPDGVYGTDQRGRLSIPVPMLVRLGLGPGKQVVVVCDPANEECMLMNDETCDQDCSDAVYTVEADGKVRITQAILERAGLGGRQSYWIEGSDSVITVRKSA